jgi:hypothetical protein
VCISARNYPREAHASSARVPGNQASFSLQSIFNQPSINRPSNSASTVNQILCCFDAIHGMLCMLVTQQINCHCHLLLCIARATSDPSHEPPTCCHCHYYLLSAYKRLPKALPSRYRPPPRSVRLQESSRCVLLVLFCSGVQGDENSRSAGGGLDSRDQAFGNGSG